jgi:hypothetical protein
MCEVSAWAAQNNKVVCVVSPATRAGVCMASICRDVQEEKEDEDRHIT